MPIYEYLCTKCKNEFEIKRLMSDIDKPVSCPDCGGVGERMVSVFGATNGKYVRPAGKQAFRGK
ncbi:MAG: zinc ribbon domain-containing protein [Chloroflexi bacterium]|nr:zinc ribbon domain-containing protein [Chloroflexota bacterium]